MDTGLIKNYVRLNVWDWLLCSLISAGLAVNLNSGWDLTGTMAYNLPIMIALSLLVQVFCFIAIYNRKTTLIMSAGAVVFLIVIIAYARSSGVLADDVNQSGKIIAIVLILSNIIVCLTSRTRIGSLALLVFGNIIIAGAAFLQFPVVTAAYLVFLFACIMLFLFKVYYVTAVNAVTGQINYEWYLGQILLITLTAILAAALVFVLIIKPLNPPTNDLKLIETLEKSQVIQKTGIASIVTLPDKDLYSKLQADNSRTTDNADENKDDENLSDKSDKQDENISEGTVKDRLEDAFAIRYEFKSYTWIAIGLLIIILIALPFVIKEFMRRKWYAAVMALGPDAQAVNIYVYLLGLFRRIDMKKGESETLEEFAARMKIASEPYDKDHAEFTELTRLYTSTYYGRHLMTEEESKLFAEYFEGIRKRVRKEIGIFKFALRYFFI